MPKRRSLVFDLLPSIIAAATAIITSVIGFEIAIYNINGAMQSKNAEINGALAGKALDIIATNHKEEAVERARNILATATTRDVGASTVPANVLDCVRSVTAYFVAPSPSPPPPPDKKNGHTMTDKDLANWMLDLSDAVESNRDNYILAMTLLREGCHLPTPDFSH
jgi:hypothetical protein